MPATYEQAIRDQWLSARDLRTVSASPLTPYQRGFEDCRYSGAYFNPYRTGTDDFWEYDCGFKDAKNQE